MRNYKILGLILGFSLLSVNEAGASCPIGCIPTGSGCAISQGRTNAGGFCPTIETTNRIKNNAASTNTQKQNGPGTYSPPSDQSVSCNNGYHLLISGMTIHCSNESGHNAGSDCNTYCTLSQQKQAEEIVAQREVDKKAEETLKKEMGLGKDEYLSDTTGDEKMNVSKTKSIVKNAKLVNDGMQFVGANAVNLMGQASTSKLGNGKMSDMLKSAKKTTNLAGTVSAATAAMNIGALAVQKKRINYHKQKLEEIRNMDPNTGYIKEIATEQNIPPSLVKAKLIREQATALSDAQGGASTSTILAGQQLTNTAFTSITAKAQQKSIDTAEDNEKLQNQIAGQGPNMLAMQGGIDQSAVTASGDETASTATGDNVGEDAGGGPGLGNPNNPFGDESLGQAPTAGAFKEGKAGGGAVGGGSAVSAGGGGAPSAGDQGDQKAQYVANFEGRDRYESGGTMVKGAGGAKGGAVGGDSGGVDFNSLLAQFLPKGEGAGEDPANGILEYGAGGRGPASVTEAPSFLDKKADIFQRIHQTYQEKQGRGHVGI